DGQAQDRDEEQQPEQETPEHAPGRPGADRVMAGVDVVAAVLVADDHRDRVRLDDQVPGQPARLLGRGLRGRLILVPDGDQVSQGVFLPCKHASPTTTPARTPVRPTHGGLNPALYRLAAQLLLCAPGQSGRAGRTGRVGTVASTTTVGARSLFCIRRYRPR